MVQVGILAIIASIVVLRFLYYWRQVFFLKGLNKTYGSFFHAYSKLDREKRVYILQEDNPTARAITKLRRRKSRFIALVKEAGFYSDNNVMYHQNLDAQTYRVDRKIAELLDETNPRYITYVLRLFENVVGYFEDRAFESFSIFYWTDFIRNLPKLILNFSIDIIRHAITGH